MGKAIRSVGAGLFAALVVVWGSAIVSMHPIYSVFAVSAAVATFVLSARHQARSLGRQEAAAIAARADRHQ